MTLFIYVGIYWVITLILVVLLRHFVFHIALPMWAVRKRHWSYFKYVMRHKYHVFKAGRSLNVSIVSLIIHDWDKFLPFMVSAYAKTFRTPDGIKQYEPNEDFWRGLNAHENRNKHHWQYWILVKPDGSITALDMPESHIREMVADWIGAGIAITGKDNVSGWYNDNAENILLHENTRKEVERLIYLHTTGRPNLDGLEKVGLI